MYTALTLRSACSYSSYRLPMSGVEGLSPRVLLGDLKGAILSRERMAPFVRSPAPRRGIRSSAGALKFQMLKPLSLHNVLTTAKIMTAPRLAVVLSEGIIWPRRITGPR